MTIRPSSWSGEPSEETRRRRQARPSAVGAQTSDGRSDASVGQLVAAVREDMSGLVRDEIDLAKAEIRRDVKSAALGAAVIAVAGVLGVLALILLSIALAYGVAALGLAPGWAFLIVAGFYLLMAAGLGLLAKSRFGALTGPERAKKKARQAMQALRATSTS